MNYFKVLGLVAATLAALPASSQAQMAYAAKEVHLRAGPAIDYPVVVTLPAGVALDVQACLSDYRWCDVVAGPDRGWVYAANIAYPYRGANVPVLNYGAVIGIGIIAFSLGNYWDSYYVGRPWYPQRPLWLHRPPPRLAPQDHRPGPRPGYRPPEGPRPPLPGVRPPGGAHPAQPGARPQREQRPSPPEHAQPMPPARPMPARPAPGGGGHRPQRGQGSDGR